MNIKILDSWLREYVKTKATPQKIAEELSLRSVSVERIEKWQNDYLYDIEITTNRPDLMSVVGLARETAAVLRHAGISATFLPLTLESLPKPRNPVPVRITNNKSLVHRICAVVMDVTIQDSPEDIKNKLEATGIRSLNNVIDITNYVMRVTGHPTHVFDYDKIANGTLFIRESRKGETIHTLDMKKHVLLGGDIVAEDGNKTIVDLLGVMGLKNSVVSATTKRILFFIDNNDPDRIRKTSMSLGIRSEAAVLNEKAIDPELAYEALVYGVSLFQKNVQGVIRSDLIDIYPTKPQQKTITASLQKIATTIGVDIPQKTCTTILSDLGFKTKQTNDTITVTVPSYRTNDISIPEDLAEEIARIYGYHNIPRQLPNIISSAIQPLESNEYYWEKRVKNALKYWGYTETYTYSMVPADLYEGPLEKAIAIKNPLTEEGMYMRKTLVPSLLQVIKENPSRSELRIFEIANIYTQNDNDLPVETRMLAGLVKKPHISFFEVKGLLEQLFTDLGIKNILFSKRKEGGTGADITIGKEQIGNIEMLDEHVVDFELNLELLIKHVSNKKIYKPIPKYPPVIEDLALIVPHDISTADVIEEIKKQSKLITDVSLLDEYHNSRTFHIVYQDTDKNLTSESVAQIRKKVIHELGKKFKTEVK